MGHSQSYDLRNPETGEKTPVRGVRRVSREHQTDGHLSTENAEAFDYREDELRERIRREQLKKREEELDTMRIRKHESQEPIIDAYRQSQTPPQAIVYNEFNHYDSLKHKSPVDPNTYFTLKPMTEINEGRRVSVPVVINRYDQVPTDPSPELARRHEIPVTTSDPQYRNIPIRQETPDYPNRTSVFNGRLSPLPRQEEVDPHPMPRYIPPMSPSIPIADSPTHLSELHAEKRMIVGIEEMQPPENVTYVTVATSSIHGADEPLHRHPEVGRHPVYVLPAQFCYEKSPPVTRNKQTQYSRRSSEDMTKILTPPKKCNVENCTHVEVNDETPVVARRRISQDVVKDKENRLTIFVDENDLESVVELANSSDSGAGSITSSQKRWNEEKLRYDSYMPTLTLRRRPIVSFYDKLH